MLWPAPPDYLWANSPASIMRMLFFLLPLAVLLPAVVSAQSYYDQQRQTREYQNLQQATQRAYSVPSSSYSAPSSGYKAPASSSGSYTPSSSSNNYNNGSSNYNPAAEQLAEQWRRNNGRYTAEERAEMAERNAQYADYARRQAKEAADRREDEARAHRSRERDAELKDIWARERRTPAETRQYSYDSMRVSIINRGHSAGAAIIEGRVYGVKLNKYSASAPASDNGFRMVIDAIKAHDDFDYTRDKATYEQLMALMDRFVVLPVSTVRDAKGLIKRFPDHKRAIMRAELRAMNYFYGADFYTELERQNIGLDMNDSLEKCWLQIYKAVPADALEAVYAGTDLRYNPIVKWASVSSSKKNRLLYYSILMKLPGQEPMTLVKLIPAADWKAWKNSWPEGYISEVLGGDTGLMLAILERNKELGLK